MSILQLPQNCIVVEIKVKEISQMETSISKKGRHSCTHIYLELFFSLESNLFIPSLPLLPQPRSELKVVEVFHHLVHIRASLWQRDIFRLRNQAGHEDTNHSKPGEYHERVAEISRALIKEGINSVRFS